MFTIDDTMINFIFGPLVALLVGLVTRTGVPAWIKSVANLLLSAIAGSIALLLSDHSELGVSKFVIAIAITWITSIASHYGFWKPTGISAAAQNVPFGIGGNQSVS